MIDVENFSRFVELLLKKTVPVFVCSGTVLSINKEKNTCEIEREDKPTLYDVRLNAIVDEFEDRFTVYPKENSQVLCILIENNKTDAYLLTCSKIEEISIKIGESSILINSDGIIYNSGELGGLIKIEELISNLNKNNEILLAILNVLNGSPVPEPGNSSPSALQAALKSAVSTKQIGDFSNLENEKVKH